MGNNSCLILVFAVFSSADNRPQPKTKKYSVVHDRQIANDTPSYALPNQTTNKTQNGTQAQGSKGKSLTVKGKKSRES